MYGFHSKELTKNVTVHFLDIDTINQDFENFIISSIKEICGGKFTGYSLDFFKSKLNDFFEKKRKDGRTARGAIAEFVIHLHLKSQSFSQEFMFLNLEEGSIKKGFDGYYSKDNIQWIVESKSSNEAKKKHKDKVKEAYDDLRVKVETKVSNNPWHNALNHMDTKAVNSKVSIVTEVRKFSEDFQQGKYQEIKELNIMPCSTLYLGDAWTPIDKDELESQLLELSMELEYRKIHIICVNNKDYQQIINLITI